MAAHVHQPASNQQQKPSFLQKLQNEQVKQGDALQGSVLWGSNAMLSSNGSPATSQVLSDDVTGSRDDVTDEVFGNALFNLSMEWRGVGGSQLVLILSFYFDISLL